MLEVRYIITTGELTAWCWDANSFGNLDRGRDTEAIAEIDAPLPQQPLGAYLFDQATHQLMANPDYIEPYDSAPDIARLQEILANSPAVITMPEIWEALRLLYVVVGGRY